MKPNLFETLSDATISNAQRNKLSLQATTSSGLSYLRKTHLKRYEVVMIVHAAKILHPMITVAAKILQQVMV